ncbi:hypothetical protein Bca52824_085373 [Brassica carinata]|uniref:Uncharacterized protein n=1 Tax=Brassica carinata TaxID=52824 RepID=A0A8X7TKU2_BRACI|nr:hypothetical protein Bca52824_085373 [Brassica carinata]
MASKALNNTANDSKQQITAISDLKPKHTTKMVHVKVLHSSSQNINHGGGGPWNSYWLMRMDTGDDKTLMPYESNEDSQEYINKQIDQADTR